MSDIKTIEGDFTGAKGQYSIVVGRWNSFVVEHLLEGAIDCLRRHGVSKSQITIVRAPGAFEIPLVCKKVAAKGEADSGSSYYSTLFRPDQLDEPASFAVRSFSREMRTAARWRAASSSASPI